MNLNTNAIFEHFINKTTVQGMAWKAKKLTVCQLVKKFYAFMEPKASVPSLQKPITEPYTESLASYLSPYILPLSQFSNTSRVSAALLKGNLTNFYISYQSLFYKSLPYAWLFNRYHWISTKLQLSLSLNTVSSLRVENWGGFEYVT